MREHDTRLLPFQEARIILPLLASFIMSAWIGFQVAEGKLKQAVAALVLICLVMLLFKLSWRSLIYISILLLTIPTRGLFTLGGWSVRLVDIVIPLTALRFLIEGQISARPAFKLGAPFLKYLSVFFLLGLISLIRVYFKFDIDVLAASGVSFVRFWFFALICLCIPAVVDSRQKLRQLVVFLALIGTFHAVLGVLEGVFYYLDFGKWIEAFYAFLGHEVHMQPISAYRAGGLQFTPENLGIVLGSFLPFMLLVPTFQDNGKETRWFISIVLAGLAIISALARSGLLLTLYFGAGFCSFKGVRPAAKWAVSIIILCILAGAVSSAHFQQRLSDITYIFDSTPNTPGTTTVGAITRLPDVWRDSLRVFRLQGEYLLGNGWATIQESFVRYGYKGSVLQSDVWKGYGGFTAGNTYLQFLNDTGLLGMLAFVFCWISAIFLAGRLWWRTGDVFTANLCLVICMFLIARGIQNIYGILLVRGDTYSVVGIVWIYLGLLSAVSWLENNPRRYERCG
jgi:hypothetical protein